MDGLSAVTARIHQIQATIGSLAPRPTASPAGSGADFASVLAAQTASQGQAGRSTTASWVAPTVQPAAANALTVSSATTPDPKLTPEQRANAEAVVAAGRSMGLSLRDQAIGVMTAMGESSLRVIDYGDKAGPDSRGLFQQRDNGAWGTYADRMDPTRSAQSFFRALERVGGRDSMSPTAVAHAVQRNADPNHYTRWWDDAVGAVSRITGASPAQITG